MPAGVQATTTYTLGFPTNKYQNFTGAGAAARDAAPDLSGGPYPLVVYSHGAYTWRQQAAYLMEHLASHGFVVMATDHEDNFGTLGEPTPLMEVSRPRDMSRMIDLAEALTATGGEMAGSIDTERVAAAGWSLVGKLPWNWPAPGSTCPNGSRLSARSSPTILTATITRPTWMRKQLAGLDLAPEGLWPDWSDPRVDVVVPLAPNANMFGGGGLDNLKVPVLLIAGSWIAR